VKALALIVMGLVLAWLGNQELDRRHELEVLRTAVAKCIPLPGEGSTMRNDSGAIDCRRYSLLRMPSIGRQEGP